KSVSVVFLEKLGYFGGFAVVMLVGVAILIPSGQMRWFLVAGALVMALMIAFVVVVLVMGYRSQGRLLALLERISALANTVLVKLKREPLDPWTKRVTASFHEAAVMVAGRPLPAVNTFVRFVLAHAFDCCCFVATGFAFGFTAIPFLIAGYVAGFIIATFILQTIGAVEVLLAIILGAYGAAPAVAAAMALCYRGLIFWVPFAIGAVCINFTGRAGGVFSKAEDKPLIEERL
ncbi:MAG: lysylphosphatidylglycerol synthase domain-containing protein, partial [Coriobacteriales bacterium]